MPQKRGILTLMGSGELTTTMVEVHKSLLRRYGRSAHAVFVDTPAGFQLNVDQISSGAVAYFNHRVQQDLHVASFKSADGSDTSAAEAFDRMRRADYLLVGPGSPTYALEQWQKSPVPDIMIQRIHAGGCLVAASAAALTVGRLTLPVYEIYKVGMPVHWVNGMDLLGRLGMDLAVVPHWNNAEGGNHDTRYCFMGQERLAALLDALPQTTRILGLDEHTALIIDFAASHATIQGIGSITLKSRQQEIIYRRGDKIPIEVLEGTSDPGHSRRPLRQARPPDAAAPAAVSGEDPWHALHACAKRVRQALDDRRDEAVAANVMEMERLLWASRQQFEEENAMGAAREILRDALAAVVSTLAARPKNRRSCLTPLVNALLLLRNRYRREKRFQEADALRDCLELGGVQVEDGPDGSDWRLDR